MDITNPQSWNRYAYVLNNPLQYTDPTGMNHCDLWAGCGSGCANDPNCGNGDDTSDGFSSWFGFGGGAIEQRVELYGQSYCELPGACGFGTQAFFGEWAYQNMVDASSGGNTPPSPGETIFVFCNGPNSYDIECLPAFFSMQYFSEGLVPYFSDPIRGLATQVSGEAGWIGTPGGVAAFYGASAAGAVTGFAAADITEVEEGALFGTRLGGNSPLLNSNNFLRIGWSYVGDDQYTFRIGGDFLGNFLDNPHINLWPPSWWLGPPGP